MRDLLVAAGALSWPLVVDARSGLILDGSHRGEGLRCKVSGDRKVIAFNFCGHGHFDLSAYERYMAGKLEDFEYPAEKVKAALAGLPKVEA